MLRRRLNESVQKQNQKAAEGEKQEKNYRPVLRFPFNCTLSFFLSSGEKIEGKLQITVGSIEPQEIRLFGVFNQGPCLCLL